MKKTLLTLAIILSLLMGGSCLAANGGITVTLNGSAINFPDAQPFINSESRTMVPVRFVSEALGANVTWVSEYSNVTIEKGGVKIDLYVGRTDAVNWAVEHMSYFELDTAPIIRDGRTFVPLRFVSENLECYVDWINETQTVAITSMNLPMSYNDWRESVEIDQTETESTVTYNSREYNIEKGDTVTEEGNKVVFHKYSGVTFEFYPENEYNIDERVLRYRIIIPKHAPLNQVITDLSDEYFYTAFLNGCYYISLVIARGMRNGIGEPIELDSYSYNGVKISDGENDTIVIEQY